MNLSTRGFPRRTFASLPAVRTQSVSGENCVLNDLNDRTGASLSQDSQVIQDSADIQDTHPLSVRADADLEALLAQWTRPDDPFALEAWEADALRTLWQQAQARNFPRLELPHYDLLILQGRAAWREALAYLKGTPAVPLTLQLLDAGATAPAPIPTPDANGAGDCPDSGTVGRIAN